MALKIIKQRELIEHEEFYHDFTRKADPGSGFWIPCDKAGTCIGNQWRRADKDALQVAELRADPDLTYNGISRRAWTYWEAAIAKCVCGRKIHLDGDTDCACGRLFNTFGQELNPNWTYMDAIENGEGDPRYEDAYD